MKKCPKCNAELQDEARFCLFCMTSFETKQTIDTPKEKSNRWFYIIALILMLTFIVSSVIVFIISGTDSVGENNTSHNSSVSSDLGVFNSDNSKIDYNSNGSSSSDIPSSQVPSKEQSEYNQSQTASNNESGTVATSSQNTSNNTPSSTNTSTTSTSSTTTTSTTSSHDTTSSNTSTSSASSTDIPSASTPSDATSSETASGTPSVVTPKFSCITATTENTYPTGSTTTYHPDNAIVITKVDYVEPNGIYVIPDTIDGKKVAAIMPSAFSDSSISSSVKSVTLPATVRTIWSDAFKNCYNLTDLYLKSAVIGIYEDAFPLTSMRNEKLTIHCKRDCRDFNFYYYRNIAERYDATYEEWNG